MQLERGKSNVADMMGDCMGGPRDRVRARSGDSEPVTSNAAGQSRVAEQLQRDARYGVDHWGSGMYGQGQYGPISRFWGAPQSYPWPEPNRNQPQRHSRSGASAASSSAALDTENESLVEPFLDDEERWGLLGTSDSEDQEGDSSDEEPPPTKKMKMLVSSETKKVLKKVMNRPLKNDKRKVLTNQFPLPALDAVHTPKLDESITCLVPKSAKTYDRYLSKLQQFSIDTMGPLIWVDDYAEKNNLPMVKQATSAAMTLMGNAAAHMSTERRKSLMKHLNKDLNTLCEGDFQDRGPYLFGEKFGSKAKNMADNIKALKGVRAQKPSRPFSGNGGPSKGKQPLGRRYNWGKNTSKNTVFSRLGPSKTKFQRSDQSRKPPKQQNQ